MKKKYVIRFTFTAHFEAESDSEALVDAYYAIRYGIRETRNTELKVVAVIPIAETEAQKEKEAVPADQAMRSETLQEAPAVQDAAKSDFPF